jgi:hypothetical protein
MSSKSDSRLRVFRAPKKDSRKDFIQRKKILKRQIAEFKAQPQSVIINRIIAELEKEHRKLEVLIRLF